MMKNKKILTFLIALVITLFIGCNNVFALRNYVYNESYTRIGGAPVTEVGEFAYNVNNKSDSVVGKFLAHEGYITSQGSGAREKIYCLDGGLDASNDLVIKHVLNPYNAHDAALLYIMTNYTNYNAQTTAIRVLNQYMSRYSSFKLYQSGHTRGTKLSYSYVNTALNWLPNMSSTKSVFGTNSYEGLKSLVSGGISSSSTWSNNDVTFKYGEYVLNENNEIVKNAKTYVNEALDFAKGVQGRYQTDGTDKRSIKLVTNNGGKNGVLEKLVSNKKDGDTRTVKDEVYFVIEFNNFNNKLNDAESLNIYNDDINGFTIKKEYKIVTDTKLSNIAKSSGWKSFTCTKGNNCSVAFADEIKNDKTYIAFRYTLEGSVKGTNGVTLKVTPSFNGINLKKYTGAYLIPESGLSQRFLVADYDFTIEKGQVEITSSFDLLGVVCEEGKTFTNRDKCEEYINNNEGNTTFDEAWCRDKTLYCTPARSCDAYSGTQYKDYDFKSCEEAKKDLTNKGASDAAYAQCIGEKLICSGTCDSLLGEFQSKAEYKGDVGAATLKSILMVYDNLLSRDPKEADKVKVNKENKTDEHVVCHSCEDYSGKTLAELGFASEADLKYQVSDPEELYVYNGVVYCSSNFCEINPDKNNLEQYRDWIRRCCRAENKKTPRDYNVEEACNNGDAAACETYNNYCSVCDPKYDINTTCVELDPGQTSKVLTPEEYTSTNSGSISGPDDIKLCVIDEESTVSNKNEYKLTKNTESNINDNPYCSVFCKEDVDFDIPKGAYTINGRYFSLSMDISSTKTCYSNKINYDKFESDYNTYLAEAQKYASNPSSKEFKNAQNNLERSIKQINACSAGWSDDYNYDPSITFTYDEKEYIDMLPNKVVNFDLAKANDPKVESWYCTGDVNNSYTSCTGTQSTTKSTINKTSYLTDGSTTTVQIPNKVSYAKKSVTKGGIYAPNAVFYTKASTGVVKYSEDGKNLINYALIEDKKFVQEKGLEIAGTLPVRLSDDRGLYNYTFTIDKVGEYFDRNETGRLINLTKNTDSDLNNINTGFKGKYVCSYVVNCPECQPECVPDPERGIVCSLPDVDDPNRCPEGGCDIKCSEYGCAYDPEYGLLYTVHQTSLIDLTNKDRTVGTNWDPETNVKAAAAIEEIEAKGEDVYKEPEYSFEFTPAVISYLRDHYKDKNYVSDETLTCENKTVSSGETYLVCKSKILTELQNEFSTKVHVTLKGRSETKSFLESDYCVKGNNVCALVGTVGPAWK